MQYVPEKADGKVLRTGDRRPEEKEKGAKGCSIGGTGAIMRKMRNVEGN